MHASVATYTRCKYNDSYICTMLTRVIATYIKKNIDQLLQSFCIQKCFRYISIHWLSKSHGVTGHWIVDGQHVWPTPPGGRRDGLSCALDIAWSGCVSDQVNCNVVVGLWHSNAAWLWVPDAWDIPFRKWFRNSASHGQPCREFTENGWMRVSQSTTDSIPGVRRP